MVKGIHVTSFKVLEELDSALGRFAGEAAEMLEALAPEVERKLDALEEHAQEHEREVRYWQQMYYEADPEEDDVGFIAGRLEEAEESLRETQRWLGRVDEYYQSYLRQVQRAMEVSGDHTARTRAFLRQKIAELYDYAGLGAASPAWQTWSGGGCSAQGAPSEATSGADTGTSASLTDFPLPSGFQWARLDEIDPRELNELPEDEKSGVSSEAVRDGLMQLRDVILPEIKEHPESINSDYFYELDRKAGRQPGVGSLQGVYDAFFGGDHIWLDRHPGDSFYRIGNGKHRIKAALDLGLPAVPAKMPNHS